MLCNRCKKHISNPKNDTLMSKLQFSRLKAGSIIKSPYGQKRVVLSTFNNRYIVLKKMNRYSTSGINETAYLYSDICKKYKLVRY